MISVWVSVLLWEHSMELHGELFGLYPEKFPVEFFLCENVLEFLNHVNTQLFHFCELYEMRQQFDTLHIEDFQVGRPQRRRLNISPYGEIVPYKKRSISPAYKWIWKTQIALESRESSEYSTLSLVVGMGKD